MIDWFADKVGRIEMFLASDTNVYAPAYICGALVLACLLWAVRPKTQGLLAFLFPQEVYRHVSTNLDVKLVVFNTLFLGLGLLPPSR